jgi:hypothetical protein
MIIIVPPSQLYAREPKIAIIIISRHNIMPNGTRNYVPYYLDYRRGQ